MSFVSRGFHRRHAEPGQEGRVPPGQYVTTDFPVLSAGPTPHTAARELDASRSPARSTSRCAGAGTSSGRCRRETVTNDIHCVTTWSKLDTHWEGVVARHAARRASRRPPSSSSRTATAATRRTSRSRTSPAGKAWIAFRLRGRAARARARRAGAAARAASLLLEEREVGARPAMRRRRRAGLLGAATATTTTATPGASSGTRATEPGSSPTVVAVGRGDAAGQQRSCCDVAGLAGHRAGQHVDVRLTAEDGYQAQRSYSIASAPEEQSLGAHGRAARRR